MKLQAKFNLAMLAAFVIGLGLASAFAFQITNDNARRDVLRQAALMASEGAGDSRYTDQEIAPLLAKAGVGFAPQMIPFLAAQDEFRRSQADWPNYSYRDVALDPTDPADRASDWQAKIINRFSAQPAMKEIVSQRDSPTGPILSVSKPIRITDAGCLQCHSTPDKAPAAMVALYGPNNGFGWTLGQVVGVQIVSAPMAVALAQARQTFVLFVAGLAFVFLVTMMALNVLLRLMIVKPAGKIAEVANEVSLGRMDIPEYPVKGRDEIASLAESFNRMRRSLANALKLLDQ